VKFMDIFKAMQETHRKQLAELNTHACENCNGSGEVDDMDAGDISYNTYKCAACNGSGWKDGKQIYG